MTEINEMQLPKKNRKDLNFLDDFIKGYKLNRKRSPERLVVSKEFYQVIRKSFGKQVPARITRQGIPVVTQ